MARKNVYTAKELLDRGLQELPCLWEPLFPKKGLVAVVGSSDIGKSSFLRQFALAIVMGKKTFLGFELKPEVKNVLYYSTEDDDDAIAYSLNKISDEIKDNEGINNLRYVIHTSNIFKELKQELKNNPADCVIIDAFADIFPGNINSVNEVRNFLNKFSTIANEFNCLIIFLHHTGKRTDALLPSKNNIIGSQGFEGRMRLVLLIRKDNNDITKRHLCIVKGNYIPEEYKSHSYVMEFSDKQIFKMLEERMNFEELIQDEDTVIKKKEAIKKAKDLKAEGKTYNEIADIISKDYFRIGKSTIGNWLKSAS